MSEYESLVKGPGQEGKKSVKVAFPVGTPDELRRHGLDPAEFGSCAPRDVANGVIGCHAYAVCPLRKELGVRRFGIRVIKSAAKGGGIKKFDGECYTAVLLANQAKADQSGDLVEIIANEGEEYEAIQSEPVKNALGQVVAYESKTVTVKVKPFPRIGENKELLQHAVAGAERVKHAKKKDEERKQVAMAENALTTGDTPAPPHKPERK